tara:strand:+ start:4702 stop:4860 length:159 start_codon:yes stop_codon:yes gene_type:complete
MKIGIDGDDENFSNWRLFQVVNFGPAKRRNSTLALVDQESFRVKPWFCLMFC